MASLDASQGDDMILARKLLTLRREILTFRIKNLGASMPAHHKRPNFPVPARAHGIQGMDWGKPVSGQLDWWVSKVQGLYHPWRNNNHGWPPWENPTAAQHSPGPHAKVPAPSTASWASSTGKPISWAGDWSDWSIWSFTNQFRRKCQSLLPETLVRNL